MNTYIVYIYVEGVEKTTLAFLVLPIIAKPYINTSIIYIFIINFVFVFENRGDSIYINQALV